MKVGYPCINLSIDCRSSSTFRLKTYTEEKLIDTVENNLKCLEIILDFNVKHNLLFFRITSDLIPFASHPTNKYDWQAHFRENFKKIGQFIRDNNIRISMHPDQFTLLNSIREDVLQNSLRELEYHAEVFNLLELDNSHKIQIHPGGIYGNKKESINRFIERYRTLPDTIKSRLVIENDDRLYSLQDCLFIYRITGIPVLFDTLHHEVLNNGENLKNAFQSFTQTWKECDGIPMVDYRSQYPAGKPGRHVQSINMKLFENFINETTGFNFDIMLEIKDKEASAVKASNFLKKDRRFTVKSLFSGTLSR
jgi:UV DNA damage endonuclease